MKNWKNPIKVFQDWENTWKDNHGEPFPIYRKPIAEADVTYEQQDFELAEAIKELNENAEKSSDISDDPFLTELVHFCEWVGYEEDTAYISCFVIHYCPISIFKAKIEKESIHGC